MVERGIVDGVRARRRPRRLAGAALVCLALAAAACSSTGTPATTTSHPTAPTTSRPTSTTTTTISPPVGGPVPAGFLPSSVTFVSTTTGFALGVTSSCPTGSCVALVRTTDGGSTWAGLAAPAAAYVAHGAPSTSSQPGVSEVRFADPLDGWAFGPDLFVTHDGARTWHQMDLGGAVVSLETSGGYVVAVVSPCTGVSVCTGPVRLEQARVSAGGFATVFTGPTAMSSGLDSLALSLHAPVGFVFLALGELYATENLANPNGWNPFPDPCASTPGLSLTSMVAPDSTTLYSLCSGNGAAGSSTKTVVVTRGGTTTVAGSTPLGGDAEALASTASGTLVVSAASGASSLYRSVDGGRTWSTAVTYNDGGMGFNDLGFTTARQGVVIHGVPGPPGNEVTQLVMTHDAGATWRVVPIG